MAEEEKREKKNSTRDRGLKNPASVTSFPVAALEFFRRRQREKENDLDRFNRPENATYFERFVVVLSFLASIDCPSEQLLPQPKRQSFGLNVTQ